LQELKQGRLSRLTVVMQEGSSISWGCPGTAASKRGKISQLADKHNDCLMDAVAEMKDSFICSPRSTGLGRPPWILYANPTQWVISVSEDVSVVQAAFQTYRRCPAHRIAYRIMRPPRKFRLVRARGFKHTGCGWQRIPVDGGIILISRSANMPTGPWREARNAFPRRSARAPSAWRWWRPTDLFLNRSTGRSATWSAFPRPNCLPDISGHHPARI